MIIRPPDASQLDLRSTRVLERVALRLYTSTGYESIARRLESRPSVHTHRQTFLLSQTWKGNVRMPTSQTFLLYTC